MDYKVTSSSLQQQISFTFIIYVNLYQIFEHIYSKAHPESNPGAVKTKTISCDWEGPK